MKLELAFGHLNYKPLVHYRFYCHYALQLNLACLSLRAGTGTTLYNLDFVNQKLGLDQVSSQVFLLNQTFKSECLQKPTL